MNKVSKRFRVGVDIGGTFTDLVMMDEDTGALEIVKMSSTPDDPSIAFLNVMERVLERHNIRPDEVSYLVHGTTVATNTIIEGKGAKTALLATEGFRDVFEIARQIRPELYNLFCDKPPPLVPRYLCFEATERLDAQGNVLTALDESTVRTAAGHMRDEGVESVVICFLHSYVDSSHEQRAAAILREELPGVGISVSSVLCPEMREYFRASTTAINALLMPIVSRYIERLEKKLAELGVNAGMHLMTSSGGMIASSLAREEPVHLIESGPAAGVTATVHIGQLAGFENLISFDMGGTTAKLGLIQSGAPRIAPHFEVGSAAVTDNRSAGYPVRTPVVDLVEIGAGGGSLAWIDPGGALRVGPRSAGADPGPACYGKGNDSPCITDANLVLGRLNPDYFIGGEISLDVEAANRAVGRLADQLGLGIYETAHGILEIANASMIGAIHLISVQRGFDPREFVLTGFGGAGPVHVNALARELGIPRILVPMSPGVTSALGLLVGDIRHTYVHTRLQPTAELDFDSMKRSFDELETRAKALLQSEGVESAQMSFSRELDMRYAGQSFELPIKIPDHALDSASVSVLEQLFFDEHKRAYGYATNDATQIVSHRMTAIGKIRRPKSLDVDPGEYDSSSARKSSRDVYFKEAGGMVQCNIYDRYKLKVHNRIPGPAIVEEVDSTTVIYPEFTATVDAHGNLVIERDKQ